MPKWHHKNFIFLRRYNLCVYTKHGIIALAGVLKSEIAAKASTEIYRKYVKMRKAFLSNSDLLLMTTETKKEIIEEYPL